MTDSPAARVRDRLNEIGVGPMPTHEALGAFRDYSPDAIGARDLGDGRVTLVDREGRSWTGAAEAALEALAALKPTDDPAVVLERLTKA